jgi:hypothetical protein
LFKHPHNGLDRRINALIYLNKDWREEYGGHFELWDKNMEHCVERILPEFNTLALFNCTSYSYHGHPDPLTCPADRSRKSLALYFYSNGRPKEEILTDVDKHYTLWKARTGDLQDKNSVKTQGKERVYGIVKSLTPPIVLRAMKNVAAI